MSKLLKYLLFLMLLPCLEIHAAEIIGESFNIGDYNFTVYYDGRVEFKGAPSDVEEVIVPEKITYKDTEYVVTGLGKYCLNKRSKLRSVKLPETITSIGEFAFANCTSLRHIDLPNSVREIGLQCFQECTSLESITLSYSLETIGSYAFDECKSLTSIVIPDNVKTIDYCAFYDCTSLKSVIIGESVQTMGSGIFSNDSNLTEIWVKAETPPYVNGTLGRDLNSDLIIYVPENSLSQYQNAYVWRSQKLQPYSPHEFNEEVVSGGLHYKYDPMTESYFVVAESEDESKNYQNLTTLIIPNQIIVGGSAYPVGGIAYNAFAGSNLTIANLAPAFKSIPAGAFRNCKELKIVKISGSIEYIGDEAFAGCDNIVEIESFIPVPPVLGKDVFPATVYEDAKLSIVKNSEEAYKQAEGWKNFYMLLHEFYEFKYGDLFFRVDTLNLEGLVIAESEDGPNYNFSSDYNKVVTIPQTVTYRDHEFSIVGIDDNAFKGASIYKLVIPESIKTIGENAFSDSKIDYVDVPSLDYWYDKLTEQNRPFLSYQGTLQINGHDLKSVTISSDTDIPFYTFAGCKGITSLEIGEGISEFHKYEGMQDVTDLVIGPDVVSISKDAVADMTSLTRIKSESMSAPLLPANSFASNVISKATLSIPAVGGVTYLNSNGWNEFAKKSFYKVKLEEYPEFEFGANDNGELIIYPANNQLTGDVVIPSSIKSQDSEYTISIAGDFYGNFTSLTIPATLKKIGSLGNCYALKKIILPGISNQNTKNPIELFFDLFTFDKSIYITNSSLFDDHKSLEVYIDNDLVTNISIPNGYNRIPCTFKGYTKLESVTIPRSAYEIEIGQGAFTGCTALSKVVFPENGGSISISPEAFANTGFTTLSIPAKVSSIAKKAFANCQNLSEVIFEKADSKLYVGDNVFDSCNLKSLYFGRELSLISGTSSYPFSGTAEAFSIVVAAPVGANMFRDANVSKVTFEKGITKIGSYAFYGCKALNSLTITSDTEQIDDYAFANCGNLWEVIFEKADSKLYVGDNVFDSCPLKSMYYGREMTITNTSSNSYPFLGTSEAFSLVVDASVGAYMFTKANISDVTFEKGITKIGSSAFYGCNALGSLTIPSDTEQIDNYAFAKCDNISDIHFSDGQTVLKVGKEAFSYGNIENLYLGRTVEYTSGYGSVFANNPNLKLVELGSYVTSIDANQFSGCPNIHSLTIGVGVRDIAQNAFSDVEIAKVIWLPNTRPQGYENIKAKVNYVSQSSYDLPNQKVYRNLSSKFWVDGILYVFNRQASDRTCVALDCKYAPIMANTVVNSEVTYQGFKFKVEEINEYTFYQNTYIEDAYIGNSIMNVGDYAFYGCNKLKSILIPNSVNILGEWAFANCESLEFAIIGTGLTEIRTGCFSGDKKLQEFMVPAEVVLIGNKVFDGCKGLKRFEVMDRETQLYLGYSEQIIDTSDNPVAGKPLFVDSELEEVYIGGDIAYSTSVEDGYSPFYRNDYLKKVTIAYKETEISDNEFYGCRNLETVHVGNDVKRVGDYAFSGCFELREFSFGSKVSSIGKDAFSDCAKLIKVTSYNPEPPVCGDQALEDIRFFDCTLYVPASAVNAYMAADQWKNFFHIEPITSVTVPVTSVTLDFSTLELLPGEQQKLEATILPTNASMPVLEWESDDPNVAMVSQFGGVVAIGSGECHITATTTDGSDISATCLVIITDTVGIDGNEVSILQVVKNGNTLTIVGANGDEWIRVMDMTGTVVYDGPEKTIEGLSKGFHIVIVRNNVFKILI